MTRSTRLGKDEMAKIEPDWNEFPNFSRSEMACSHCGRAEMDSDTMWKLQELRDAYGKPMKVTSAYRCPQHPIEARKAKPGAHASGRAIDIAVSRNEAYVLMRLALKFGWQGIGVQQKGDKRFLHIDDLTEKEGWPRPTVWSY
jgi:zinc D-Ala-D-Ala carboxypeptidase